MVTPVILYSTNCPKCKMLEKQLEKYNVPYTVCHDIEVMKSLGLQSAPFLGAGDALLDFAAAWKWIAERGKA